jgi:hypothetical protein
MEIAPLLRRRFHLRENCKPLAVRCEIVVQNTVDVVNVRESEAAWRA